MRSQCTHACFTTMVLHHGTVSSPLAADRPVCLPSWLVLCFLLQAPLPLGLFSACAVQRH